MGRRGNTNTKKIAFFILGEALIEDEILDQLSLSYKVIKETPWKNRCEIYSHGKLTYQGTCQPVASFKDCAKFAVYNFCKVSGRIVP